VLTPTLGLRFGIEQFLIIVFIVLLVSFALTALGFAVAWRLDSTQAFHGIVNLFLLPMWMLSGALFPYAGASEWVRVLMRINPITYGVEGIRQSLFPTASAYGMPLERSLLVLVLFSATMFFVALAIATRRSSGRAA
jgi:ABC-2 type transport system permease protein